MRPQEDGVTILPTGVWMCSPRGGTTGKRQKRVKTIHWPQRLTPVKSSEEEEVECCKVSMADKLKSTTLHCMCSCV